jgi:hypothetical protein
VPLADSRALRSALPGHVQLVEFPGAGHVDSWRSDPARYDAAIRRFLLATARRTLVARDVRAGTPQRLSLRFPFLRRRRHGSGLTACRYGLASRSPSSLWGG